MAEYASKNTVIEWSDGTNTATLNVVSFGGPSVSADTIEVSDLSDTYKQFISAGLSDSGELTCEVNLDPSTSGDHDEILDACAAGTSGTMNIQFPDATTVTYSANAFVTAFSPKGSVGDAITADMSFKLTDVLTVS